jgi:NADPH-dependent 2,4-dienoyl-CoA reductase/sulfur reductase-like enzyme
MGERVVIIGGSAAGLAAAGRARRLRPDLNLVILEAGPVLGPPICSAPYALSGEVAELSGLARWKPEDLAERRGIRAYLRTQVTALRPGQRQVIAKTQEGTQELRYDRLLLATGYRARELPLPGAELAGVHQAARYQDYQALLSDAPPGGAHAVVIGGGYIGLEMVEALIRRGLRVTLFEKSGALLPMVDPELSPLIQAELARHGVEVRLSETIVGFQGSSAGRLEGVHLRGPTPPLSCQLAVVCVGVVPETDLARSAGIALGKSGAIAVDERQRTSAPEVFAAGNCAEVRHRTSGQPLFLPLATVAVQQGRVAGDSLAGRPTAHPGAVGSAVLRIFDLTVAGAGLTRGQAEAAGFRVEVSEVEVSARARGFGTEPVRVRLLIERRDGRLLGGQLIGGASCAHRINVLATALASGWTAEQLGELDFAYAPPYGPVSDPLGIAARAAARLATRG